MTAGARRRNGLAAAIALTVGIAAGCVSATTTDEPSEQTSTVQIPSEGPSTPSAAPSGPGTIVMWGRDAVHADVLDDVETLDGILAATFTRSDTIGLVGAQAADGTVVSALDDGWQIPVQVAAIDPDTYVATMGDYPETRELVAGLQPGMALLSATSADIREIGVGGQVDLVGLAGLTVVGIVPDGMVGRAELVIHEADADAAGLEPDGSILARHERPPGADTDALVATIEDLFPEDAAVRVFDADADTEPRRAPLILSLTQVKSRFGEFAYRPLTGQREVVPDPTFVDQNITEAEVPVLGTVRCHRLIVDDLRAALQEIVDEGYSADIDPSAYAGCYYPRRISTDGSSLSRHSWGIALDINVDLSLPGLGPPPRPEIIDIFGRHGFRWGGDFLRPDNHHFEWVGEAAATRPER